VLAVHTGSLELSAEHFGRMDYPPSILGRELLVPSCAHAVMLPGVSRLAPQARAALSDVAAGGASRQLLGLAARVLRRVRGLCVPCIRVLSQDSLAGLVWAWRAPGHTARQQPRRLEGTVE